MYQQAERLERPVVYLESSRKNKEAIAREIAQQDNVRSGLIAVLSCVEPCITFSIRRNRQKKRLELVQSLRKCLNFYHYCMDPIFGFMHTRIQSWFPFNVQVYVNGREWLAVEMDKAGIQYRRRENCFTWVEDAHAAQQLLDEQLKTNWPHILNRLSRFVNPLQDKLFPPSGLDYYWSVYSSEWATDVTFRNSSSLAEIYPALVHHAITNFSSPDVMRFLGKRIRTDFSGEVVSRFRDRPEGLRIKHALDLNSVKLYDKQGSVLRVETTIQRAEGMRCYRPKEGDPNGPLEWRPLRRGIADLHRRAQLSQDSNERYLDALAACDTLNPTRSTPRSRQPKNSMEWLHPPSSSPLGRSGRPTPRRYFPWRVSSARLSQQGTPCLALSQDFGRPSRNQAAKRTRHPAHSHPPSPPSCQKSSQNFSLQTHKARSATLLRITYRKLSLPR